MKRTVRYICLILVILMSAAVPAFADDALPESYDPRPDGTSAIREQGWGTCWDFGGISTLESYLIKNSLADKSIDLSEEDVLWWANVSPEGYGWTNRNRNDGGYGFMTAGYLMCVGARTEADIPYLEMTGDPDIDMFNGYYMAGDNQRPENYFTAPAVYEVTDIAFLNEAAPETVKRLILTYGAVTASYYDDPDCFREDTSAFWFSGIREEGNHTVSVVGWDDSFPKEDFAAQEGLLPENDGAWLIKNSYGTDYGCDGGYIWISYDDTMLFRTADMNPVYAVVNARIPAGQKRYAADEFGAVAFWEPGNGDTEVFANVYDFCESEALSEVTFAAGTAGCGYDLYYAPAEEGIPSSDRNEWTHLSSGTAEYAGYTTVKLENRLNVPEGEGAVVLELTGGDPGIGTDENLLRYGRPIFNSDNSGRAYILTEDGFVQAEREKETNGFVYTEKVDIVLRAYTVPAEEEPPVKPDVQTGTAAYMPVLLIVMAAAAFILAAASKRRKKETR